MKVFLLQLCVSIIAFIILDALIRSYDLETVSVVIFSVLISGSVIKDKSKNNDDEN